MDSSPPTATLKLSLHLVLGPTSVRNPTLPTTLVSSWSLLSSHSHLGKATASMNTIIDLFNGFRHRLGEVLPRPCQRPDPPPPPAPRAGPGRQQDQGYKHKTLDGPRSIALQTVSTANPSGQSYILAKVAGIFIRNTG